MRNVDATIKQARSLGSGKRLTLGEIDAIKRRTIKGEGRFDLFSLIGDAYDFGFMLGYRMKKKSTKEKADRL